MWLSEVKKYTEVKLAIPGKAWFLRSVERGFSGLSRFLWKGASGPGFSSVVSSPAV